MVAVRASAGAFDLVVSPAASSACDNLWNLRAD